MKRWKGRKGVLLAVAAIWLAACGRRQDAASGDGPAAGASDSGGDQGAGGAQSAGDDRAEAAAAKLNGYIKGYNTLLSTFGLQAEYRLYAAQHLSQKGGAGLIINVSAGWLDNARDELKAAHALPRDGMGELDAVGDRIVPDLDRLVVELKGLQIYYESRGYLQDNFARGQREDPQVLADFKTCFADMDQLNQVLDRQIAKRDQAELDGLKRQGDMVGYDGELALQKSKALIHLFNTAEDMRNPALFQRGDALVATIESALADERQQLAKPKRGDDSDHAMRNSGMTTAADRLEIMIGHYRDLKQNGVPFNYQMMISAYNDAIENTNIMQ